MNGGEALVETLAAHGVDTVFCVPGESYLAVLEALRRRSNTMRLVTNRHESGATFAANAYGKLAHRPGIACVSRGPGATNASMVTYIVPVVGLISGALVRGERFGPNVLVGAIVLIGGVWLAQRTDTRAVPEQGSSTVIEPSLSPGP